MSAYRELAAARPAPASWSGALLVLLALLTGAAGPLVMSAGLGATGQTTLAAPLLPTLAPDTLLSPDRRKVLAEVGKQVVEQPLHFMMAAAPILLSRGLAGVPWYGWAATPLLAWREWSQWPSKRWWDPPLDWAFLTLGVVTATWRRRAGRPAEGSPQASPRPPSHPLRRAGPRPPASGRAPADRRDTSAAPEVEGPAGPGLMS
jgi:hypothetical protein